jgi:hypothetical protein
VFGEMPKEHAGDVAVKPTLGVPTGACDIGSSLAHLA